MTCNDYPILSVNRSITQFYQVTAAPSPLKWQQIEKIELFKHTVTVLQTNGCYLPASHTGFRQVLR